MERRADQRKQQSRKHRHDALEETKPDTKDLPTQPLNLEEKKHREGNLCNRHLIELVSEYKKIAKDAERKRMEEVRGSTD